MKRTKMVFFSYLDSDPHIKRERLMGSHGLSREQEHDLLNELSALAIHETCPSPYELDKLIEEDPLMFGSMNYLDQIWGDEIDFYGMSERDIALETYNAYMQKQLVVLFWTRWESALTIQLRVFPNRLAIESVYLTK